MPLGFSAHDRQSAFIAYYVIFASCFHLYTHATLYYRMLPGIDWRSWKPCRARTFGVGISGLLSTRVIGVCLFGRVHDDKLIDGSHERSQKPHHASRSLGDRLCLRQGGDLARTLLTGILAKRASLISVKLKRGTPILVTYFPNASIWADSIPLLRSPISFSFAIFCPHSTWSECVESGDILFSDQFLFYFSRPVISLLSLVDFIAHSAVIFNAVYL